MHEMMNGLFHDIIFKFKTDFDHGYFMSYLYCLCTDNDHSYLQKPYCSVL